MRRPYLHSKVPTESRKRYGVGPLYVSYGTRETEEVDIEESVNRLVELYPTLDPVGTGEVISEQMQEMVAAASKGERY